MRLRSRVLPVIESMETRRLFAAAVDHFGEYHGVATLHAASSVSASSSRVILDLQSAGTDDAEAVTGKVNLRRLGLLRVVGKLSSDGQLVLSLARNSRSAAKNLSITAIDRGTVNFRGTITETIDGQTLRGDLRLNFVKRTTSTMGGGAGFGGGGTGFGVSAAAANQPASTTVSSAGTTTTTTRTTTTSTNNGNFGVAIGSFGVAIGEPGVAMGQPGVAMGEPGSAMGTPGVGIGQPGSAMGTPGVAMGLPGVGMGMFRDDLVP